MRPSVVLALGLAPMTAACFPEVKVEGGGSPDATIAPPGDAAPGDRDGTTAPEGGASDASAPEGGGDASSRRCPAGRGPSMVLVEPSPSTAYCIDTTEVTNAQFDDFLSVAPADASAPPMCNRWRVDQKAKDALPSRAALPVERANFCDAWAFCSWSGKRLCGRIGGGRALRSASSQNEWFHACVGGGANAFPYGATYDGAACTTTLDGGAPALTPVGTKARCRGLVRPFDAIFDMVGNVAEYDDFATSDDDFVSGGAYPFVQLFAGSSGGDVALGCNARGELGPHYRDVGFGIRCCADPVR